MATFNDNNGVRIWINGHEIGEADYIDAGRVETSFVERLPQSQLDSLKSKASIVIDIGDFVQSLIKNIELKRRGDFN